MDKIGSLVIVHDCCNLDVEETFITMATIKRSLVVHAKVMLLNFYEVIDKVQEFIVAIKPQTFFKIGNSIMDVNFFLKHDTPSWSPIFTLSLTPTCFRLIQIFKIHWNFPTSSQFKFYSATIFIKPSENLPSSDQQSWLRWRVAQDWEFLLLAQFTKIKGIFTIHEVGVNGCERCFMHVWLLGIPSCRRSRSLIWCCIGERRRSWKSLTSKQTN